MRVNEAEINGKILHEVDTDGPLNEYTPPLGAGTLEGMFTFVGEGAPLRHTFNANTEDELWAKARDFADNMAKRGRKFSEWDMTELVDYSKKYMREAAEGGGAPNLNDFVDMMAGAMESQGIGDVFEPVNTFEIHDAADALPPDAPPEVVNEATKAEKEAEPVVGKLTSGNTKLKGMQAFTLPARTSCPSGCLLSKNPLSTCAGCFGDDGQYRMNPAVKEKLASNMAKIDEALKTEVGTNLWIAAMARLIGSKGESGYFRVHDVGDFFRKDYFPMWVAVANALPKWKFWVPTKEFDIAKQYKDIIPPNLILRVSTPLVDKPPIQLQGVDLPTATVHWLEHPYGFPCPAPEQGGKCGTCRACWDLSVRNVSYELHGRKNISRYEKAAGKKEDIKGGRKRFGSLPSPEEREKRKSSGGGYQVPAVKESRLNEGAKSFVNFEKGGRYEVMKPGAYLSTEKATGPWSWTYESTKLSPGDIIQYLGTFSGRGSDTVGEAYFKDELTTHKGTFQPNFWGRVEEGWLTPFDPKVGFLHEAGRRGKHEDVVDPKTGQIKKSWAEEELFIEAPPQARDSDYVTLNVRKAKAGWVGPSGYKKMTDKNSPVIATVTISKPEAIALIKAKDGAKQILDLAAKAQPIKMKRTVREARSFKDERSQVVYNDLPFLTQKAWDSFSEAAEAEGFDVDNDGVSGATMSKLSSGTRDLYFKFLRLLRDTDEKKVAIDIKG